MSFYDYYALITMVTMYHNDYYGDYVSLLLLCNNVSLWLQYITMVTMYYYGYYVLLWLLCISTGIFTAMGSTAVL